MQKETEDTLYRIWIIQKAIIIMTILSFFYILLFLFYHYILNSAV